MIDSVLSPTVCMIASDRLYYHDLMVALRDWRPKSYVFARPLGEHFLPVDEYAQSEWDEWDYFDHYDERALICYIVKHV